MVMGEEAEQRWGLALAGSLALLASFILPWLAFCFIWTGGDSVTRFLERHHPDLSQLDNVSAWLIDFTPVKLFLLIATGFYCHACLNHRFDLLPRVRRVLMLFSPISFAASLAWMLMVSWFAKVWLHPSNASAQPRFAAELSFWMINSAYTAVTVSAVLVAWGIWRTKLSDSAPR